MADDREVGNDRSDVEPRRMSESDDDRYRVAAGRRGRAGGYGSEYDAWSTGAGFDPAGFGFGPAERPGHPFFRDDDWQVNRPARGRSAWAGDWAYSDEALEEEMARRRERFRGTPPKNYRRSDERISDDVCQQLTDDPGVDASDIDVSVNGGEVTLEGTVRSREQKWRAEDIAARVMGVLNVFNRLRVGRKERGERGGAAEPPSVAADRGR